MPGGGGTRTYIRLSGDDLVGLEGQRAEGLAGSRYMTARLEKVPGINRGL